MNTIIVTGGNGFIGRHLIRKLVSSNEYSVVVISNKTSDDGFLAERKFNSSNKLSYYTADILDSNAISQIMRDQEADTCIHLAAKISVPDSIKNPQETMEVNVKGTLNVLEGCCIGKVSNFIFASSAAVYGEVTNLPISEDQPLRPLSPYGESKMLSEQHVLNYGKLNKIPNTVSLRIFNVYGVGQTSGSDVVTRFAKRLSKGLAPIIAGDGTHTRDFISVDDVAEAMLSSIRAIKNNFYNGLDSTPIFNIGSGTVTSISALALKMISIAGLDVTPEYREAISGSGVILHSYADIMKAKKHLQFFAKKDLEFGLREVIEEGRI